MYCSASSRRVSPVLKDLSKYGVGIHIDDFGTGYSSLSYLAELPVQTLKIDRSFIGRLTESETNARVVQAVIALGKAMGLEVIAEGVDTEQQMKMLHTLQSLKMVHQLAYLKEM